MSNPRRWMVNPWPAIWNPEGKRLWEETNWQELWKQSRGELLGYADYLEARSAKITASQIRMAVHAGDELHLSRTVVVDRDKPGYDPGMDHKAQAKQ